MIDHLVGVIVQKTSTGVVLEVGGVGFGVITSTQTSAHLVENQTTKLYTHLYVREDALQLFGFCDLQEKELFRLLLQVSGIGPKLSISILSGLSGDLIREAIISNNSAQLNSISGVGKKTAERIIIELRDKVLNHNKKSPAGSIDVPNTLSANQQHRNDAYSALLALGYNKNIADKVLRKVIQELPNGNSEELIRSALKGIQNA